MSLQVTPRIPILLLSLGTTAALAVYGIRYYRRRGPDSALRAFIALMIALSVSLLAETLLRAVTAPELKLLGFNFLNAIGIWLTGFSFVWFALAYSNTTRWLNRWFVGIAVTIPVGLTTAVVLAPEYLYTVDGVVSQGPVTILGITFQEWVSLDRTIKQPFTLVVLTTTTIGLFGIGVLGRYLFEHRGELYTGQAVAIAVGGSSPILSAVLLASGIFPPELSTTGVAYGITAIGFGVAIFRYRLFEVSPVGHQQVVTNMTDPVVMLNHESRVVDCNPAANDLFDPPENWAGMPAADFFAPLSETVQQVLLGDTQQSEISIEHNGTTRHFAPEMSPIQNTRYTPQGRLIVLRDITTLKQRETELQRENERLDQFAHTVSHDLQSPLTIAQANLARLAADTNSEYIEEIETAHDRIEQLIDDIFGLAKAGETVEEPQDVRLVAAASAAIDYTDLAERNLDVTIPQSTTIRADYDRLVRVFENLYRNAVQHNDSDVTVRVGMLQDSASGDPERNRLGFFIEDTGDGIPEEKRSKVFASGYTTDSDGTGFGLSIVKDIVDVHGWDIQITASQEGGARFEITHISTDE